MKYAIYGISCGGKDTFINKLLASGKFPGYEHPKGSETLNLIAQGNFGKTFKELSSEDKDLVRVKYAAELSQKENILADGHFCFPKNGSFEVVFTDSDAECYDAFFYLKAKPEVVKERIANSEKNQKYTNLTVEDIAAWQDNEIAGLRAECFKRNKDFVVLDDDYESVLEFLTLYDANFKYVDAYQQACRLAGICKIFSSGKIALIDCDRTLVQEDTGTLFFKANNASLEPVKELFAGDIYSQYQFWKYQEMYRNFSVLPSVEQVYFNPIVTSKIEELQKQGFLIVGVTSGISDIWKEFHQENDVMDLILCSDSCLGITISDLVKGYLSKILSRENEVFACGDSMTDIYMLEAASQGVIYAPGKIRSSVQEYLNRHPETKIKQFEQNNFRYNNIEVVL